MSSRSHIHTFFTFQGKEEEMQHRMYQISNFHHDEEQQSGADKFLRLEHFLFSLYSAIEFQKAAEKQKNKVGE